MNETFEPDVDISITARQTEVKLFEGQKQQFTIIKLN